MNLHLSLESLLTPETTGESLMDPWYPLTSWLSLR